MNEAIELERVEGWWWREEDCEDGVVLAVGCISDRKIKGQQLQNKQGQSAW